MYEHMTLGRRTATALVAVLGLLLALLSLQAAPAHAAGKLTATFTSADNGSWWKGTYILHNDTDTAVTGWNLEFDLPAGVAVDTSYNGTVTTRGSHVTAVNAHYNGTVAAHGTSEPYSFWFVATGPLAAPNGCRINGDKCDGSSDAPPGAPGGLKQTDVTARTASLSWTAASAGDFPVASYDILAGGKVMGSATAATSVTVTGLTPATAYSFTVRAKDTRGNTSAESAPLAVTTVDPATDTSPPTAPGSLHATAADSSSVTLAWTAATDNQRVAAYDIYRGGALDQDPYDFHFSADAAIKACTDAGVEPRKLTLGIPFYGRGWQNVADGGAAGEWQTAGAAAPGQFAEEAGTRGYANLIGAYPTMTVHHDEQSVSTYGYTGSQWWSFDDAWSIGKKTDYVKSKGLLGVMIWEMSGDTSQGTLMNALDTGLK